MGLTVEKVKELLEKLPTMSPSASKIMSMANDPECAPADLINVIKVDMVLTAKVLKLVNSAYFALPNQIPSINQAVVLLGINTLKNLAFSTAMVSVVNTSKIKAKNYDDNVFWEHSIAVSVAGKMLARKAGVNRAILEEFFISGLLHDIGKVIFMTFFTEPYDKLLGKLATSGKTLEELEKQTTGLSHSEVGEYMASTWKLSPILQRIIKNHHILTPIEGDEPQHAITVLADIAAHRAGFGEVFAGDLEGALQYPEELLASTKLTVDQLKEVEELLPEELEKAKILLSL